jgi:hypothetical protein
VVFLLIQSLNRRGDPRLLIDRVLLEITPYLLPTFERYVEEPLLDCFNFKTEAEVLDFLVKWSDPSFKFNAQIRQRLSVSLGRLYLYLWNELNKVSNDIPKEIDYIKLKKTISVKM